MQLSNEEKKLVLSAKKKGMKGLSDAEKRAVLKYRKIMEAEKKAKSQEAPKKEEDKEEHKLSLSAKEKALVMSARKKGMKGLSDDEKRAVLKYRKIMEAEKKAKSQEAPKEEESQSQPKKSEAKLRVIKQTIPDIKGVKKEHFKKFKGKKLLIAEDNLINFKMLDAILGNSGIEIDHAKNGKEVIEFLKRGNRYDMVLMDIEMPQLDGLDATKMIRKSSRYDMMPVVALTSASDKESILKMFKAGMNAYLSKPVALGKLYNVFKLFMGDK